MDDLLSQITQKQKVADVTPFKAHISNSIKSVIMVQHVVTVHRSKLHSIFDSLRKFDRAYSPSPSVSIDTHRELLSRFDSLLQGLKQLVHESSASKWSSVCLSKSHRYMHDRVKALRDDLLKCVKEFPGSDPSPFQVSAETLALQDKVDMMQLKASLMDYLAQYRLKPNDAEGSKLIASLEKIISDIGPLPGISDGPPVIEVPPFLKEKKSSLELDYGSIEIKQMVGSGAFGTVYIGFIPPNRRRVAVKVLTAKCLGGRQLETFKREVWTMANVDHPSILKLIGVTLRQPFCMVTELLQTSLQNRIKMISPTRRSIIAYKVAQGVEAMHKAKVLHRDLKSGNILLDEFDNPRVCDFGLVGFLTPEPRTGFVGTCQWMAPEVIISTPYYTEKADVYSFGILLWEMLTLKMPYEGMMQDYVVMGVLDGLRPTISPQYGPPKLIELICSCWHQDPAARPTMTQVVEALKCKEYHFMGTNEDEFASETSEKEPPKQAVEEISPELEKLLDNAAKPSPTGGAFDLMAGSGASDVKSFDIFGDKTVGSNKQSAIAKTNNTGIDILGIGGGNESPSPASKNVSNNGQRPDLFGDSGGTKSSREVSSSKNPSNDTPDRSTLTSTSRRLSDSNKIETIIQSLSPEFVKKDPTILSVVMNSFSVVSDSFKIRFLNIVPKLGNFETFITGSNGLNFILECLQMTDTVKDATVSALRCVDLTSPAFREGKLFKVLSKSYNFSALMLIADLCEFSDVAGHVTGFCLPLVDTDKLGKMGDNRDSPIERAVVHAYQNILMHKKLVSTASKGSELLIMASRIIKSRPSEACAALSLFDFGVGSHVDVILNLNLIPLVAAETDFNTDALKALVKMIHVVPAEKLITFKDILSGVVRKHCSYFKDSTSVLQGINVDIPKSK